MVHELLELAIQDFKTGWIHDEINEITDNIFLGKKPDFFRH